MNPPYQVEMKTKTNKCFLADRIFIRDRSLILPGEGVEDIWEGGDQNSAHSEGNKEHFKRRTMEFLLKSWSGDQNSYINLRRATKIPSNI